MELSIHPHATNQFPLNGFLIQHSSVNMWLKEITRMQLSYTEIQCFPIPGTVANTIWGCFVITNHPVSKELIGKNEWCQQVHPNLFIPEKTRLFPNLESHEIDALFSKSVCIIHPTFGLVELTQETQFSELIIQPTVLSDTIHTPTDSVFIPNKITSFQIQAIPPEEVLKQLEDSTFPKQEKLEEKPLNPFEKLKLSLYKTLFNSKKKTGKPTNGDAGALPKSGIPSGKESWFSKLLSRFTFGEKLANHLKQDMEELERRNQKMIDKLMEMLRDNPDEALKYAIPLDENGSSRGGDLGQFDLSQRWSNFSWMGNASFSSGSSGGYMNNDHYATLQQQYNKTAETLIAKKEFQKAAFVYFKLLKNPIKAAETLEIGNYYQEAAAIFLQPPHRAKGRAADAYEKGKMYKESIQLRIELEEFEKAGDLYRKIGAKKEAEKQYNIVVENHLKANLFVKASIVYEEKLNHLSAAKATLMDGWEAKTDAVNCLNRYLDRTTELTDVLNEITTIHTGNLDEQQELNLLEVVKTQYAKNDEIGLQLRDIAYEIVAKKAQTSPAIVSELKLFNPTNKEFVKDTMRFTMRNKSRLKK